MTDYLNVIRSLNEKLPEDFISPFVITTDGNMTIISCGSLEMFNSEDSEYFLSREAFLNLAKIEVIDNNVASGRKNWFKEKHIHEGFVYEGSDEYEDVIYSEDFVYEAVKKAISFYCKPLLSLLKK